MSVVNVRSRSALVQSCSTPLKPVVAGCNVFPPSSVNTAAVSPLNVTRLVQLADVAIDSHENALDCRVDSASMSQHDSLGGLKSESSAGGQQYCNAVGSSLVVDGRLSAGNVPVQKK